ncbi:MAG: VIT1/CCC1 transporter family protein [Patescibacteria group bacterium]
MPNLKSSLRDIILGGQDGLVNVLGVVLGVSAATSDLKIIMVSGLAATFAESISMAAVAYTSTEASMSKYLSDLKEEEKEVETTPQEGLRDVEQVFRKWGFEGNLLREATYKITSNKDTWTKFMMTEERREQKDGFEKPLASAFIVGTSSLLGSIVPLLPYFILRTPQSSMVYSIIISALFLFILGFTKAKLTLGNPFSSGLKITAIGIASAIVGFIIGKVLGESNI